ncbi:DUF6273 domain-containing protein [Carnobacterium maltaromaticum]|uniref:DUF6273 domain-containing protein n=1 Tax=Carnobacterium maltaromaticum TaxID=2751 RepID=UPI0039BE26FD
MISSLLIRHNYREQISNAAYEATPATTNNWWLRTPNSSTNVWNVNNDSNAGQFNNNE